MYWISILHANRLERDQTVKAYQPSPRSGPWFIRLYSCSTHPFLLYRWLDELIVALWHDLQVCMLDWGLAVGRIGSD